MELVKSGLGGVREYHYVIKLAPASPKFRATGSNTRMHSAGTKRQAPIHWTFPFHAPRILCIIRSARTAPTKHKLVTLAVRAFE